MEQVISSADIPISNKRDYKTNLPRRYKEFDISYS